MQKHTRSILDELESIYQEKHSGSDQNYIIESRARNVIASAVRLVEQMEEAYTEQEAENLSRKFLNAIRTRDANKFARALRKSTPKGSDDGR
jgi:hypothetical protein